MAFTSSPAPAFGFFSKLILIFFVLLLICNFFVVAYENKSLAPAIYETGKSFFIPTQKVSDMSQQIVDNKGIVITQDTLFGKISAYLNFLFAITSMLLGIRTIAFLISLTPWGNSMNVFYNFSLAFVFSYFIQALSLIGYYASIGGISGLTGASGLFYYLGLPIMAFINLFKALPYVLVPVMHQVKNICNSTNSSICRI